MSVVLISFQNYREQLGLKQLHYILLAKKKDSFLFYLNYFQLSDTKALNGVLKKIDELQPFFVGISLMSIEFDKAVLLTEKIHDTFPGLPVIWGGMHPTVAPEMSLEHADFICIGEGDNTIVDLYAAYEENRPLQGINNLAYLDNSRHVTKNSLYSLNTELDKLPFCRHIPENTYVLHKKDMVPLTESLFKKYNSSKGNTYTIISSRGCPYSCTYCCNSFYSKLYKNPPVRRRSVSNIIGELVKARSEFSGLDFVNFEDDSFLSCEIDYLREFVREYKSKVTIPFIIHSIPVYVTEEKLKLLKEAGIAWINLGLQSASPNTLNGIYNRKSTKETFVKAANLLHQTKVAGFFDVLVDNPFEEDNDRIETIQALFETPLPFILRTFSITFYPGAELYEKYIKTFPDRKNNYLTKNFCFVPNKSINNLTKIAPYIHKQMGFFLIKQYRRNKNSSAFTIILFGLKFIITLFVKPFVFVRLIRWTYQGSYKLTIINLHRYVIHYLTKHFLHYFGIGRNNDVLPF